MAEVETRVDGLGTAVLASKTRELQQAGTAPSSDHSLTASEQRFKSKLDLVTARVRS
ncbi:hypothetical protein HaLaN_04600 [Haematococcus lacustris]|uniref:Uncharacterized protein n=1 Tax=Haematococcus lacustris TaxID=44745 RepID=A0A699YH10_HAELA|nr:hypothetical protein HaLaN_04600 [Haematococcus lacustris]